MFKCHARHRGGTLERKSILLYTSSSRGNEVQNGIDRAVVMIGLM